MTIVLGKSVEATCNPRDSLHWRRNAIIAQLPRKPFDMTLKSCLYALSFHAAEEHSCYPKVETIAKTMGASERTADSALARLVELAAISIDNPDRRGGRSKTNTYRIHLDKLRQFVPVNPAVTAPFEDENPAAETGYLTTNPAADALFETEKGGIWCANPAADDINPAAAAPERDIKMMKEETQEDNHIAPEATSVMTVPANFLAEQFASWLGRPVRVTKNRLAAIKQRWRDPWWRDNWQAALERASQSSFLRGEKGGWRITFDFFLKPDSVAKIMEGTYDDRGDTGSMSASQRREQQNARAFQRIRDAIAADPGEIQPESSVIVIEQQKTPAALPETPSPITKSTKPRMSLKDAAAALKARGANHSTTEVK